MSSCPSAGPGNTSLGPPSNAVPTSTARSWKQRPKAGQKALDAFTKLQQIVPGGLDSQQTATFHSLYASCGKHIEKAAKSTGHNFAKHYSNAYNACNQIQCGFPENTTSRGTIQTNLTPLFVGMTDLSQAAYIDLHGTKAAANLSEDGLHDHWVKGPDLNGKLFCFLYIYCAEVVQLTWTHAHVSRNEDCMQQCSQRAQHQT